MNLSKTLKVSLLALVVASATGSALTIKAEEAKKPAKGTTTVTVPNFKTTLKYGFKFGEAFIPYAAIIAYFVYGSPQVKKYVNNNKDMKTGIDEIIKCLMGVWFGDTIKKHAEIIRDTVANGKELILGA